MNLWSSICCLPEILSLITSSREINDYTKDILVFKRRLVASITHLMGLSVCLSSKKIWPEQSSINQAWTVFKEPSWISTKCQSTPFEPQSLPNYPRCRGKRMRFFYKGIFYNKTFSKIKKFSREYNQRTIYLE